ncbi:MAG TPA: hypothetical protein VG457_13460, partial [Planctomycetota bacterium]|nr:hypothetical protein [Planctomycetota bacterium]
MNKLTAWGLAALLSASAARAQTDFGAPRGALLETPGAIAPDVVEELRSIAEPLASIDVSAGGTTLSDALEAIQRAAASDAAPHRRDAAALVLNIAARGVDERALLARRVPRPIVTRLSVVALRAHTAAKTDERLRRLLESIRARPVESADAPAPSMTILRTFKPGVFEADWQGRLGVLKAIAASDEGRVQGAARAALLGARIDAVKVPELYGDWHVLDVPKTIAKEAFESRKANMRFVWMEKVPGVSLAEILKHGRFDKQPPHVREALPEPIQPRVLVSLKRAFGALHDAGITHGDLDPLNLHLTQRDGETTIYVIDWGFGRTNSGGVAKKRDRIRVSRAVTFLESGGFVAEPEEPAKSERPARAYM